MTDRIELRGLVVRGHHGVFDHEKRDGQDFIVDVVLWLDLRAAAVSDDLADTVDYAAIAHGVVEEIAGPPVNLIETLATRIADRVLRSALVAEVTVTVHKPQAPVGVPFTDVCVQITRSP